MALTLGTRLLRMQLRLTKPIARFATIEDARKAQDQLGRMTAEILKTKVSFEMVEFDRFTACFAESNNCVEPCDRVILYLHGGGYTAGGLDYAKGFGALLAAQTHVTVLCIAYRLAPEHKFPAAQDDAMDAYQYLLDSGYSPDKIAVAGESAGGGLALSLVLRLRDEGKPLPSCVVAISPWADLTLSGSSYNNNVRLDPTLIRESLAYYVIAYAAGHEDEAYVSPVLGDFAGFPPTLLFAGSDEILLSDAKTVYKRLKKAGVESTLVVEEGMWHVYPLYGTPEGKKALLDMALFLRSRLGLEELSAAQKQELPAQTSTNPA
ncbi:MAG TPA: alpha/beta hydrolase [Clostridia bacterium]|nr:alpha/beta hydrolase [Clostridia bacterium]